MKIRRQEICADILSTLMFTAFVYFMDTKNKTKQNTCAIATSGSTKNVA